MSDFRNVIFPKETPRENPNPDTINTISDISINSKFLQLNKSPELIFDYQNYSDSISNIKYHRNIDKKSKSVEKIIYQDKSENIDIITPVSDSQLGSKSKDDLSSITPEIPNIKRNDLNNVNNNQIASTFDLNIKDINLDNDNDQLYEFKKQLLEKEEEKNDNETIEKLKALRAKYLPSSLEKDPSVVETNLNFNSTYTSFYNRDQNSLCNSTHGKTPLISFSKTFVNNTKINFQNNTNSNDFSGDNKSSTNCFRSNSNFRCFFDKLMNDDNNLKNKIFILKEKDNKIKQLIEENKRLNNELIELDLKYKSLNQEYSKFKTDKDSENKETVKKLKQEKDNYKEYLIKENKELNKKTKKYDLALIPLIEYINQINDLLGFKKINILSLKQTIKSEKDTKIDNPFIGIITFLKYCGNKAQEIFEKEKEKKNKKSNKDKDKIEIDNYKKQATFSQKEIKNNFDFQSFAALAKPKILDKYNVSVVKSKTLKKGTKSSNVKNSRRNSSSNKNSNGKKKRIDEELGYWRGNTYVKVKI